MVFTDPEVGSIGLTEAAAREAGYDVQVGKFPFTASGKAKIEGKTAGFVKVVRETKYDEVLGVHIVGLHATDLIAEACVALNLETTAEELIRTIHAHPTLAEAVGEAAHASHGAAIHISERDRDPDMKRNPGPLHPAAEERGERLAPTTLGRDDQLRLYHFMKLTRMVEARLGNLYRQGKVVGGLYSSLGQEATAVGSAYALGPGDFMGPLIRNLGSMLVRGVQPREVMAQYLAKGASPTGGKDGNTHFGDLSRGLVAPISMLGALIPVMAGVALAGRMQGQDLVALTYIGDGGTSTGDFHEGLNFAAVQNLPLVVVAENNGYAYSTPVAMQMRIKHIAARAAAYGIPGEICDGNDVLAVYEATRRAVERARRPAAARP